MITALLNNPASARILPTRRKRQRVDYDRFGRDIDSVVDNVLAYNEILRTNHWFAICIYHFLFWKPDPQMANDKFKCI